jgi:hypothetical protein
VASSRQASIANCSQNPEAGLGSIGRSIGSSVQQLTQDDSVVMRFVTRRVHKRYDPMPSHLAQSIEFTAVLLKLISISPADLLPAGGIMSEPFS